MKHYMIFILLVATLVAQTLAVNATGRLQCETIATDSWLSKAQLTENLIKQGWKVPFMKEDGGCWEVYGTTPEGQRVEAYFHPASGKKLLVLQRGQVLFREEQE